MLPPVITFAFRRRARPRPRPVTKLRRLIDSGRAPHLTKFWGRWRGDCEVAAVAALIDLARAGAASGWRHLGSKTYFGPHHWLES
jgi:hypothetical protein